MWGGQKTCEEAKKLVRRQETCEEARNLWGGKNVWRNWMKTCEKTWSWIWSWTLIQVTMTSEATNPFVQWPLDNEDDTTTSTFTYDIWFSSKWQSIYDYSILIKCSIINGLLLMTFSWKKLVIWNVWKKVCLFFFFFFFIKKTESIKKSRRILKFRWWKLVCGYQRVK